MLGKLFRPRWQHADARKRLDAVTGLQPEQARQREILIQLALHDADASVRQAALERFSDPRHLEPLRTQGPEPLRQRAQEYWLQLLAGRRGQWPLDMRMAQLEQLEEPALLAQVAGLTQDDALRQRLQQRLTDPEALHALALHGQDPAQRLQAAQQLSDPADWRRLTRDSRDKRVQQWAREQLRRHQDAQQSAAQRARQRETLLSDLRQHAQRPLDSLYGPRLQQTLQQWEQVAEDAPAEQQQALAQWRQACEARLAARQAELEQARERERIRSEQDDTLEQMQSLLDEVLHNGCDSPGTLRAALQIHQRHWLHLQEQQPAEDAAQARHARLEQRLEQVLGAAQAWLDRQSTAEDWLQAEHLEEDTLAQIRDWLQSWPEGLPMPDRLERLARRLAPAPAAPAPAPATRVPAIAGQEDTDRLLHSLQRALRQRNLRQANRLWHKLVLHLETFPDSARPARQEKLQAELEELRDWHAFAAAPKKEELVQRMEALAAEAMDVEEKATAIQALHDEWRSLMSSNQDADQALWDRFKAASDLAYAPCREHFRELDAERGRVLARRAALCDQLEALLERSTAQPEGCDWSALFQIRRQIPDEFRALQPVRYTDARTVNRRFSALLTRFDALLKDITERHAAELSACLQEAEAARDLEDVRQGAERIKALQQRWKQAGWVHPQQYRSLHRAFRQCADQVFSRLQEERRLERSQQDQDRQHLLQALEAFAADWPQLDGTQLSQRIEALTALPWPRRETALLDRRDRLLRSARQALADQPRRLRKEALRSRIQAAPERSDPCEAQRQLAIRLEVAADIPSPESDRELRRTWQLQILSSAMRSSTPDALDACEQHLDEAIALLEQGLAPPIRARLLQALDALR